MWIVFWQSKTAGTCGVIRNDKRKWFRDYSQNIGFANNMIAKLCGIRDGLQQARQMNIQLLEVEVDSQAVIDFCF